MIIAGNFSCSQEPACSEVISLKVKQGLMPVSRLIGLTVSKISSNYVKFAPSYLEFRS